MDTNTSSNYSVLTVRMSFKKKSSEWRSHTELPSVHFHINSHQLSSTRSHQSHFTAPCSGKWGWQTTSFSSGSRQREVSHKVPPDLDRVTNRLWWSDRLHLRVRREHTVARARLWSPKHLTGDSSFAAWRSLKPRTGTGQKNNYTYYPFYFRCLLKPTRMPDKPFQVNRK